MHELRGETPLTVCSRLRMTRIQDNELRHKVDRPREPRAAAAAKDTFFTRARMYRPADKAFRAALVRQFGLGSCVVDIQGCCFGLNVITAVEFSVTGDSGQSFQRAQDRQLFRVSEDIALQNRCAGLVCLPSTSPTSAEISVNTPT